LIQIAEGPRTRAELLSASIKKLHRKTGGKPLALDMGRNAAAVLTALNLPNSRSFVV